MSSPYVIVLPAAADAASAARVGAGRTEYRDRLRAKIVLEVAHADQRSPRALISLIATLTTGRKWRRRLAAGRLDGLKDRPRSGCPLVHGAGVRAEAVALSASA